MENTIAGILKDAHKKKRPVYRLIINLLKEKNTDRIPYRTLPDNIKKKIGVPSYSAFCAKLRKRNILKQPTAEVKLTKEPSPDTPKPKTIVRERRSPDDIMKIIAQSGTAGVSTKTLLEETKRTKTAVWSALNRLRKKGKIKGVKGLYIAKTTDGVKLEPSQNPTGSLQIPNLIPLKKIFTASILRDGSKLNPEDQSDFFDFVKKTIFYKRVAENLVSANNMVIDLKKALIDGDL